MREDVASRSALTHLVESLADNKYFLGRRYAEWCTSAPTLEAAVAAAAMAQDEIGHARSLYPLLRDLVTAGEEMEPENRTRFANAPFLNDPFDGWTDFVAANFLFDTAITVLLGAADGSLTALAQRARRMLGEEQLHWLHAVGWIRRLRSKGPAVRVSLAASLSHVSPEALSWFDIADDSLLAEGVLLARADTLRERFRDRVNPVLSQVDLPTV